MHVLDFPKLYRSHVVKAMKPRSLRWAGCMVKSGGRRQGHRIFIWKTSFGRVTWEMENDLVVLFH
jgi:hypothetical protein